MAGRRRPSAQELAEGVLEGHRARLAQAITLVESTSPQHREKAAELLSRVGPHAGGAHRVGITGVPGVGKSTFIEAFGMMLVERGHRVAVLAVDPSSSRSGGSILADKTRMERLSTDPRAYVRPSPSSGTLGGVTRVTRETMTLVEAAGFDVVLVETVGVGQSETVVSDMVDFFLVLMIAGAGDEFQGIKKGVLELADMLAVNKADGDGRVRARKAASEYRAALHIMTPADAPWQPPVLTCSALAGEGLEELWAKILEHRRTLEERGLFVDKRRGQLLRWTWAMVEDELQARLRASPSVNAARGPIEAAVLDGSLPPAEAAGQILAAFDERT
jgi:LAO/AO transport system kinase